MTSHYRICIVVDGRNRYLRINRDGKRDWTPHIDEATSWSSAGEADEVRRTIKPVPVKRIKWSKGDEPSKVVAA